MDDFLVNYNISKQTKVFESVTYQVIMKEIEILFQRNCHKNLSSDSFEANFVYSIKRSL